MSESLKEPQCKREFAEDKYTFVSGQETQEAQKSGAELVRGEMNAVEKIKSRFRDTLDGDSEEEKTKNDSSSSSSSSEDEGTEKNGTRGTFPQTYNHAKIISIYFLYFSVNN